MRNLVFVLILLVSPLVGFSQTWPLGQTRQAIIKHYSECYIVKNTDTNLQLHCGDDEKIFEFDETTHLSNVYGRQLPLSLLPNFSAILKNAGWNLYTHPEGLGLSHEALEVYCYGNLGCIIYVGTGDTFMAIVRDFSWCSLFER